MQRCLRQLWLTSARYDLDLHVSHIPGVHNVFADCLSRWDADSTFQRKFMNSLLSVTFVSHVIRGQRGFSLWPFLMGALWLCCRSSQASSTNHHQIFAHWILSDPTWSSRVSIRRFNPAELELPHKDLSDILWGGFVRSVSSDCKINYTLHSLFSVTRPRLWYYPESFK